MRSYGIVSAAEPATTAGEGSSEMLGRINSFRAGTGFGFICLWAAAAPAQVSTSEARDLRNLGGDVWSVWTSPGRLDRAHLGPVGAAAGGIAIAIAADPLIWRWLSSHSDAGPLRLLGPLRDGGVPVLKDLTTSTYLLPLTAAAYAAGRLSHSTALRDGGLGCAASYVGSLGFRLAAVAVVKRTRPYREQGSLDVAVPGLGDWDHRSFTAGHTGNAAACATFLAQRYSLGAGEPLLYLYVATLGVARMTDGWHWTSDTITGVLVGMAVGAAVADRQLGRVGPAAGTGPATMVRVPALRFSFSF